MSSSSSEQQKTVSLPAFSGKKKDYLVWQKRFQSYAVLKKFSEALEESFVLPADPENLTTSGDWRKRKRPL